MGKGASLSWWDLVVVVLYFVVVIVFGIWSSRKNRGSVSGYFLAARDMHWVPVGASLFSSCIGAAQFVGLAGSAAASGIAAAGFELGAELYAGALFIQLALNKTSDEWLYVSILILLGIAALFTITGGLTAVIWTDFIQTILMIGGAVVLMGKTFYEVGGLNGLIEKYPYAIAHNISSNDSCGKPPSNYLHLFRSIEASEAFPWTGIIFGLTISSIWYWCTDQVIVQRTLASKNLSHAKAGCILASYIKIFPMFILILPGMAARVLFPDRIGCTDPEECKAICGNEGGCTNIAYIELVIRLMPSGLAGLMVSVMMAAVMSSLTSIFNSSSTIFTIDIWTRFRKQATDKELLIVGRITVVVLVAISTIWIPVLQNSGNATLFDYTQSITSFLAPSICAVFILAIFWPRTNEQGAFWGLMIGLVIGMIRFVVQFSFPPPPCGSDMMSSGFYYTNYLFRLTFWSRYSTKVRRRIENHIVGPNKKQIENGGRKQFENGEVKKSRIEEVDFASILKEDPKTKLIVDCNAIFCLCVIVFIWGFFA
ncbi:High-affinity proline transporter PutP [Armadillidium nasatum]|uniref:High-affinity proline transporter PutP n=1 Tax=Armadillidium nasatum TaxID=96803 RepID=A0A5N5T500_9CRUS|nr:High-affinity proline transporter PutP [Armadillidium nasatum]